jgi:hypothetical protein
MIRRRRTAALLCAIGLAGCASVQDWIVRPSVSRFSDGQPGAVLPAGWEPWTLSRLKKRTRYQLVTDSGRTVVHAQAEASASGLIHRLNIDAADYRLLGWRWKVGELVAGADNSRKHTEDAPVRVAVTFDGNYDRLPLDERILFDTVRLFSGQQMRRSGPSSATRTPAGSA